MIHHEKKKDICVYVLLVDNANSCQCACPAESVVVAEVYW
jgi:hypothetical protein